MFNRRVFFAGLGEICRNMRITDEFLLPLLGNIGHQRDSRGVIQHTELIYPSGDTLHSLRQPLLSYWGLGELSNGM